jgi:hypothetical protein
MSYSYVNLLEGNPTKSAGFAEMSPASAVEHSS